MAYGRPGQLASAIGDVITGGTPGSVLFVGAGGALSQDNTNFFFNDATNQLLAALFAATGLVDISAAGAGQIQFPAVQNASANPNTLDDYETGTWTPTDASGAGLILTINGTSTYTKIGDEFTANTSITYPATASGAAASIGGFPFTFNINPASGQGLVSWVNTSLLSFIVPSQNVTVAPLFQASGAATTNAQLSTRTMQFQCHSFI